MGGRALKEFGVTRISDAEYKNRIQRFNAVMRNRPEECGTTIYFIPGDVEKEDRGDLDVIYYSARPDLVVKYLEKVFNSKGRKKNGNVNSIEWEGFQVDMIHVDSAKLMFAAHYYAHGTCAALMGRLARYYGFKLGWNGFGFQLQVDNQKEQFTLTHKWEEALKVLGYHEVLDFEQNYKQEEIFDFLKGSTLLSKKIFRSSNPDRNYGFQEEFFAWVENQDVPETGRPRVYGWYLLYKYYPLTAVKLTFKYLSMWVNYFVRPVKRRWRKVWFNRLMPLAFKLRGW